MAAHTVSRSVYFMVFGALMVLTAVTVAVAFVDLGFLNIVVAMSIAVTKAVLVILFFMHLRYGSHLTWIWAGASFFWLAILLSLTVSDYLSRGW
jgi:cytochrome c oxidase subunit 4